MTTYYLDASALSKRYVQETGTTWMRELVDPATGHTLLTSRVTMVEIYSALVRRKREGTVPSADCDTAAQAFTAHSNIDYEFIELDLDVVTITREVLEQHALRAYDAV
jgi:predicted nucleic acid-binding protein